MKSSACMLSHVQLFATPWTVARIPLSTGFSMQEYWSGLPFPPPGDLPDPGVKLVSPVSPATAGGFLSAVSVQSFSVSVFIYWTWRVSTAKVGLLKWRGLKLAVDQQEGPRTWCCHLTSCKTSEGWLPPDHAMLSRSVISLCNPMECTVHGILQARILEWVAFPLSRGSSQPRD